MKGPLSRTSAGAFAMQQFLLGVALVCSGIRAEPIQLGDRREIFVDTLLLEKMENVRVELGRPRLEEIVMRCERPWENSMGGVTILKDRHVYRMYYRGGAMLPNGEPDPYGEVTCYAESVDGVNWVKPSLGLHEFNGSRNNNIILGNQAMPSGGMIRVSHNFAPFLDDRPGVPPDERYKAIGGRGPISGRGDPKKDPWGVLRYASGDGIHWRLLSHEPLFAGYALDSRNVCMWIPHEGCYAIYLRTWTEGGTPDRPTVGGIRTVSRSTSKDFQTWTAPEKMTFGDRPLEHIYTTGTYPYFRAPHILIALAWRMVPDKTVLSDEEMNSIGVRQDQRKGMHDVVLMSTRGGNSYTRTFMESFIRPGLDKRGWHARNHQPSLGGVVATGDDEMSFYLAKHNTLRSAHLQRYSLRLDGFSSIHSGAVEGTVLSKPLRFTGESYLMNYSTSVAGSILVELCDEGGAPIPGYAFSDCNEITGDSIERAVVWRGSNRVGPLQGRPIRISLRMKDADIFSLRFGQAAATR